MEQADLWKRLYTLGIVLNAIVLLAGIVQYRLPSPQPDFTSYRSSKYGYTVGYPRGWNVREIEVKDRYLEARFTPGGDTYLASAGFSSAIMQANLLGKKRESLNRPLIDICHEAALKDLRTRHSCFGTGPTTEVKAGLAPWARSTDFRFLDRRPLMARGMRGRIVTAWNEPKPIELMLVAPLVDFRRAEPVFAAFLKSFRTGTPLGIDFGGPL